jgi:hypothetical protein
MTNFLTKGVLAATLAATAVTATPAMARDYHRGNGDDAAIAIGAGIVGLAIGAIIAGSNKHDRYDSRYHVRDGWYYDQGSYYNRSGHRYSRDDWQRRYGARYDRRYRNNGQEYYNRRGYDDGDYGRYGY